jgi:hypothetical protein
MTARRRSAERQRIAAASCFDKLKETAVSAALLPMPKRLDRVPNSLFTSHGLVLIAAHRRPHATIEQISEETGLAPRYVTIVLGQLRHLGFLWRRPDSRLVVNPHRPMLHPMFGRRPTGRLLRRIDELFRAPASEDPHRE